MSGDGLALDCSVRVELETWLCPVVTLLDKAFFRSCSDGLVTSACAVADLIAHTVIKKGPQPKILLHAGKLSVGVIDESKERNKREEVELQLSGNL